MDMNKTITISRGDLLEAFKDAMNGEALNKLIESQPMLVLLITMINVEVDKVLFKEEV